MILLATIVNIFCVSGTVSGMMLYVTTVVTLIGACGTSDKGTEQGNDTLMEVTEKQNLLLLECTVSQLYLCLHFH